MTRPADWLRTLARYAGSRTGVTVHILNVYHCYRYCKIKLAEYLTPTRDSCIVVFGPRVGCSRQTGDKDIPTQPRRYGFRVRHGAANSEFAPELLAGRYSSRLMNIVSWRWTVQYNRKLIDKATLSIEEVVCAAISLPSVRFQSSRPDPG